MASKSGYPDAGQGGTRMFRARPVLVSLVLLAAAGAAAAPAIGVRSVTNGVSLADPPATVPRGGVLTIRGEGLATEYVGAESAPLPVLLGDPPVQVLINDTEAPLFFVAPNQINAQVPWEVPAGRAEVVVRVGEESSAASLVQVATINLTLVRHDGTGAPITEGLAPPADSPAEPARSAPIALGGPNEPPSATGEVLDADTAISPGSMLRVFAAGTGLTTPALVTGSAAAVDTVYEVVAPQRAFLGGLPVESLSVTPSTSLVGVYEMTFNVPAMAGPTEVFRWVAGTQGASGAMGPINEPTARYMAAPAGVTFADRIQLSSLNPYFVSLSAALDENQGCYAGTHLLDFRRDSSTTLTDCLFPSWPNAPNPNNQHRPFEAPANSAVLAALIAPPAAPAAGLSDQLLLVDTAAGTRETVAIEGGADRLQPGLGTSSTLRLERPGGAAGHAVVNLSGDEVGEAATVMALPVPLVVDDLRYLVAQNLTLPGGYRLRFLEPEYVAEGAGPQAVLFDAAANVVTKVPFPEGWAPLQPPRRLNANGDPIGALSLAPVTAGFAGQTTAYVGARKTDRSGDGVVAFEMTPPPPASPDAPPDTPEAAATLTATAIEFPTGVFVANCTNAVRWLRIPANRSLAIVGTDTALEEFAEPRESQICAGDQVLVFDTESREVSQIAAGEGVRLDVWLRGTVNSYVYFGDGAREVPYRASTKIHVIDIATGTYQEIVFPEDEAGNAVGIPYNNQQTHHIFSESKLVALATVGDVRVNNAGFLLQPFPGDAGLLVVDLEQATAIHLPLPDGFERIEPGSFQLIQQGRRGFGMMPVINRAFANVRRTGAPPGTGIVTWDVATQAATVISLPEEAYATVRPLDGPGAGQRPFLWDVKADSGTIAFGVYNEARDLIGVAVVGP